MLKYFIKKTVMRSSFLSSLYKQHMIKIGKWETYDDHVKRIEDGICVKLRNEIDLSKIKVGLVKDMQTVLDHDYLSYGAYFPKYERFLNNNNIKFEYYDIFKHDWQEKAKEYDAIIWHTDSTPSEQNIAKNKLYVLDKLMGKKVHPSFDEIWAYEDKVNAHYLYSHYKLPQIETIVTHSKQDAMQLIETKQFPLISKITTGSASNGVIKLNNKYQAKKLINSVFSDRGKKTYIAGSPQKDYVIFQKFVKADYDLRIIVVGEKLFGYYRFPNGKDFRASGSGNYGKKEIPFDALDLAFNVKKLYRANFLAVDLLFDKEDEKYLIIETSIFIGVETNEQLVVNGIPGYYNRLSEGAYSFAEGKYWVQELALEQFFKSEF